MALTMSTAADTNDFPYYLSEGANLTIRHSTYGTIYATVVRPFLPRTSLQLVLARLTRAVRPCPLSEGLLFVLKVYDNRFTGSRSPRQDDIPWSVASEQRGWAQYQRNPMKRTPTTTLDPDWERPTHGDDDEGIPADPDGVWECFYFRAMDTCFLAERASYIQLSSLQGTEIPVFYGDGVLDISGTTPPRVRNPPVILLEYIPNAVTLRDVNPRVLTESLMRSMLNVVDHINGLNVLLTDINPGNFMYAPADRPTRAIAVDFADARLRSPDEPDESWAEMVSLESAPSGIRLWLRMQFQKTGLPTPKLVQRRFA